MSKDNLVYEVSEWQKHLWKYHKMVEQNAENAERVGRERYEAFPSFAEEIFHRMFSEKPERLEHPADGSEVFQRLHDKIDEIPEMESLRQRCKGNENWSGIGTTAVIDTLMAEMPAPDKKVEDLRGDEDVEKYLREAIENAQTEEDRQFLEETLESQMDPNVPGSLAERREAAEQAAEALDDTQIRNAIRKAAQQAEERIAEEEAMMDSLSFGMDPHSGQKARMAVHKKLSKILGENKRIKEIAKLAGRMRRIAMEQQRQKPQKGTDEVAGVELGSNINKMVPSEALFMDDEVEMVFATKLHEHSLAQFELSKIPKKEQGPVVMLIDSSGSMGGGPDIWAAAVALAFLEIAFKQKRPFAICFFGGRVLKTEMFSDWSKINHADILDTVSFFAADGGTNFEDPLCEGIKLIEAAGSFAEADIIMVTDGVASVSHQFLTNWKKKKLELDFSCYSILVGGSTEKETNRKFSDETELLNDVLRDDESMHKFFKRV